VGGTHGPHWHLRGNKGNQQQAGTEEPGDCYELHGFLSCCLGSLLLRRTQDGAQPLTDNHFLSGFDRHGN
jgi:hypothetical protein